MAVRFSAAGQHYTSTAALPTGAVTMLCWMQIVVDRDTTGAALNFDATTNGYFLGVNNDGVSAVLNSVAGDIPGAALAVGSWYKIAATINGAVGTLYYGLPTAALSTATGSISTGLTFASFAIGAGGPGLADWLNGCIANVKHYSAVLTATEIEAEFNSWNAVRTANLVRHHRLRVPETTDYSGNGNTLSGGSGAAAASDPPIPPPPRLPRVLTQAAVHRAHYW